MFLYPRCENDTSQEMEAELKDDSEIIIMFTLLATRAENKTKSGNTNAKDN